MAEELTSRNDASAPPSGQAQTSENDAPQNQAKQEGKSKVNLFELPEFKGYQASVNRTVSQLQAQLKELQDRQVSSALEGMDEAGRANFLLQQKEQELAQYREAMQQQQIQQQRWQDIQSLAQMTGAPADALQQAETYDEAVKLSIQWMKENGATSKEIKEAKAEANRVDLGGGAAVTPQDREGRERGDLLKRGDTRSYMLKILEG